MIYTEEILNTAFYDWIQLTFPGIAVQRLHGNGPRPDLPYISYKIMGFNKIGEFETSRPDTGGNATIKGHIEMPVYFQAHGEEAMSKMQELSRSVYVPDIQEFLSTAISTGFVQELSPPTAIPFQLDSSYEERASLDMLFRTHDMLTVSTGCIETVEVEVDYNDGEFIDNYVIDLTP